VFDLSRRKFIESVSATLAFFGLKAKANIVDSKFTDKFYDIFHRIDASNNKGNIIVPLILPDDSPTYSINKKYEIDKQFSNGEVFINSFKIKENINKEAMKLIVAAGSDRNMVVYDSECRSGEFSLKLVSLMNQVARRNLILNRKQNLTDIFMRKSHMYQPPTNLKTIGEAINKKHHIQQIYGVSIHGIDDDSWNIVEEFYRSSCKGSYGPNDRNIVIGVIRDEYNFLNPVFTKLEMGLAILSNSNILLGSF